VTYSVAGAVGAQPGDSAAGPGRGAGLVIAVDGPAGSGKSSAARGVAVALGLRYLDTGAMYRAVTWWLLEHGIDPADADQVTALLPEISLTIGTDTGAQLVRVGGTDVTAQIRARRVSNAVSAVASIPQVRSHLIARQRALIAEAAASGPGIVAEGRDIGTVVAPDAAVKVFLTASEQVRAERRAAELTGLPGQLAAPDLTLREQARRDRKDAPQTQRAADAVEIDATDLALDQVIDAIVRLTRSRAGI
jgi:CMP/dCMP kinase